VRELEVGEWLSWLGTLPLI